MPLRYELEFPGVFFHKMTGLKEIKDWTVRLMTRSIQTATIYQLDSDEIRVKTCFHVVKQKRMCTFCHHTTEHIQFHDLDEDRIETYCNLCASWVVN